MKAVLKSIEPNTKQYYRKTTKYPIWKWEL